MARRRLVPLDERLRALTRRDHREQGMEGVQFAAVVLVLLLLGFGTLQGALYFITAMQATAAAHAGVQAARTETGTAGDATAAAGSIAGQVGIASQVSVQVERNAADTTVTVTARSPQLIPMLPLPQVVATAHGTVERPT
jgi:Flp pilus assembly protein TadG